MEGAYIFRRLSLPICEDNAALQLLRSSLMSSIIANNFSIRHLEDLFQCDLYIYL